MISSNSDSRFEVGHDAFERVSLYSEVRETYVPSACMNRGITAPLVVCNPESEHLSIAHATRVPSTSTV